MLQASDWAMTESQAPWSERPLNSNDRAFSLKRLSFNTNHVGLGSLFEHMSAVALGKKTLQDI